VRHVDILGVRLSNLAPDEALALLERTMDGERPAEHRAVYIVNAHTLNLAWESPAYRCALNRGFRVLADGTGARWAARLRGVRLKANLVGTDLVPALLGRSCADSRRYFLLGADAATIARAADYAACAFPHWTLAGYHHGYVQEAASAGRVIALINRSRPDLLLVGMGNPLQELWIDRHRDGLQVPLSIGVGGLFDHWAGTLVRAPRWVRKLGCEWAQLMLQQPHKWRRYLFGNPRFLARVLRTARVEHTRVLSPE